jgi:hypothetical protein
LYIGHAGTTNTFAAGNDASFNTSVGVAALDSNTRGNLNTAVGWSAGSAITTGIQNTAVGALSLNNSLVNSNNTAIGYQAITNADGFQNTALGSNAGSNITGYITSSIYIGYNAFGLNAGGISGQTINEIVIGADNTGLGSNTVVLGNSNITKTILRANVGIGNTNPTHSLTVQGFVTASAFTGSFRGDGSALTGVVASATPGGSNGTIQFNDSSTTSGSGTFTFEKTTNNVILTGSLKVTGSVEIYGMVNSLFTMSAFSPSASGFADGNISIGNKVPIFNAGVETSNNNSGSGNVFLGNYIGVFATAFPGYANTGVGTGVFYTNNSGHSNAAFGYNALRGLRSGSHNTGIGAESLNSLTNGSFNIALGYQSGRLPIVGSSLSNASGSIFIGTDVRPSGTSPLNQVIIGDRATGIGNNSVVLGNDNVTTTILKGNIGIGNTAPTHSLTVQGFVTASAFTGSFRGDGSGLTGVVASAAPGGVNTTVQFNDAGSTSGSTSFTFNKNTNTVTMQGSGSTLLVVTGSRGELFKVSDSGSLSTLAAFTSGSINILEITNTGIDITGSLEVSSTFTASLQSGYVWVGGPNNRTITIPTSSIAGGSGGGSSAASSLFLFFNY